MPTVDLPEEADLRSVAARVDAWVARTLEAGGALVAAERHDVTDGTASDRWYLRFRGEEKDVITVWLTLQQRTLHHEVQFMPAPEENLAGTYRYLLRRNADLFEMAFCLGDEDAVYLVGRVPAALVDDDELDRIAGSSLHYVDEHFPTAMTLGFGSAYRRRPRRRTP